MYYLMFLYIYGRKVEEDGGIGLRFKCYKAIVSVIQLPSINLTLPSTLEQPTWIIIFIYNSKSKLDSLLNDISIIVVTLKDKGRPQCQWLASLGCWCTFDGVSAAAGPG